MLKTARRQLPQLREICPELLVDELNQVRILRNRFAHDPIRFEFTPPPHTQIRAILVSRDRADEITSEYVFANWELFIRCSSAVTDCLLKLQTRFDKFATGKR